MEIEKKKVALGNHPKPVKKGWSITGTELSFLWTEIWPKLVALGWKDPRKVVGGATKYYRTEFASSTDFRTCEASRVADLLGLSYNSNIPIHLTNADKLGISMPFMARIWRTDSAQTRAFHVREPIAKPDSNGSGSGPGDSAFCLGNMYGETFFVISEDGIFMPWPDTPSVPEILMGYIQGGGVLPRKGAPVAPLIPPAPTLNDMEDFPTQIGGNNFPGKIRSVVSGVSALVLLEKWQNMVALAWEDDTGQRTVDIQNFPKKYIAPEVWSTWPDTVAVSVLPGTSDFVIKHDPKSNKKPLHVDVPIPDKPQNADDYFEELIIGHASNPMYSNCY